MEIVGDDLVVCSDGVKLDVLIRILAWRKGFNVGSYADGALPKDYFIDTV